ncbi:hypothetical protein JW948_16585 [bacterium]|nr:hypothetical protein [bacterium]
MFRKKNVKDIRQQALFLVLCMAVLCFTHAVAGETEGGDTPQAVFKAAQAAGAKKDFATLANLVGPSERAMLAFGTDMGVGMFVEFYEGEKSDELKKKYQKIQDKYGIKDIDEDDSEKLQVTEDTPQEVIDAHIRKRAEKKFGKIDATKLVPDLMGLVAGMPEMAEQTFFPQEKLTDLKIEGDKASGMSGEKKVMFIKEKGRWYLTADVMN